MEVKKKNLRRSQTPALSFLREGGVADRWLGGKARAGFPERRITTFRSRILLVNQGIRAERTYVQGLIVGKTRIHKSKM